MRTIKQAEKECRAAWALHPDATYGWCIHHGKEWEELTEPIENRIDYILSSKAKTEQITRLDNMRPVSKASLRRILSAEKAYHEEVRNRAGKAYDEAIAPAEKAYDEAIAPARKAYEEAIATAWKAYNEARATAEKAYDEAIAPAHKAYKEYSEAVDTARKAYDEARATAGKAYDEAITSAHKTDVPNHTWNGKDIF